MNNLAANYGALLYPNYPKNWFDLTRDERIELLTSYLKKKNQDATKNEIKNNARNLASLS